MKFLVLLLLVTSCASNCLKQDVVTITEVVDDCYKGFCTVKTSNGVVLRKRNPYMGQKIVVCSQYKQDC